MSTRALFPEGAIVHQNALVFERDARISDHLQRALDSASMGAVSGFQVTPNGVDATKIDVAAGTGYCPLGEYVVLSPGQSSIQLASGVLGTVNYVLAVATEVISVPVTHESNGTSPNSRATRSVRIRVYTEAQYNSLPASDPNPANDAIDRSLILAKVTATGGALTASDIELPTSFNNINFASAPVNITGVSITAISSNAVEGTGTLSFTLIGTLLSWQAPGAGAPGATQNVGSGGSFILAGGDGSTLAVYVISASLPGADQADTITITNLYTQDIPRYSSDDDLHRSLLGTGTPSPTNPHGITVEDIGGIGLAELETHQDIMHSNGIWNGSSPTTLLVSVNEAPAPDQLLIVAPAGVDTYWVNGVRLTSVSPTTIDFAGYPVNHALYEVLVDNSGAASTSQRAVWPNPQTVTGVEVIDVSDNVPAGARNLAYTNVGQTLSWDGGPAVAITADGRYKLISSNDLYTIEVYVTFLSLPGADQTDSITVNALANTDTYLRLAMACWHGSALGFIGFGTPGSRQVIDKRLFGTIAVADIRDDAIEELVEERWNELRASGVVIGLDRTEANSLKVTVSAGLDVNVAGGVSYVLGKRFERAEGATTTVADNATSYVYIDTAGAVQSSDTLTLSQLLGDSTLNNPGLGVVLAKVTAAAGAITEVLDYRRNIARLDNIVGSLTVAGELGGRTRAQFFSLQAALDYAAEIGVADVLVTGDLSEALASAISLTDKLRIRVEPAAVVTFTGAASSVFSIGSGGALEWLGGGVTVSGSQTTLIDYGGSSTSWVIFRDADIVLGGACALFTNTNNTVHDQGVRFEGCGIDNNSSADTVSFGDGWDGLFLFRDCEVNNGTQGLFRDTLAGSDTLNRVSVLDCDIASGSGTWHVYLSDNVTAADWQFVGNIFSGGNCVQFRGGSTERCSFIDNEWDCGSSANYGFLFNPAGTGTGQHLNFLFKGNTMRAQGGLSPVYILGRDDARFTNLRIEFNVFGNPPTAQETIQFTPDGTSDWEDIHICGNQIGEGRIQIGDAGAGASPTFRNVIIDGNTLSGSEGSGGGAISLSNSVEEFSVINNHVVHSGSDRGISVSANSENGTIANNTVRSTSSTCDHGIYARSDYTTISGNFVEQPDSSSSTSGVRSDGDHCTVTGNVIQTASDGASDNGIDNGGNFATITGNSVEFTDTAGGTLGTGIQNTGTDVTITGNTVSAAKATSVLGLGSVGDRVAVTGNKLPMTSVGTDDVLVSGDECAFIGNVVVASDGTLGDATVGAGGGTSVGAVTTNVVGVLTLS